VNDLLPPAKAMTMAELTAAIGMFMCNLDDALAAVTWAKVAKLLAKWPPLEGIVGTS
jgi:hypothetical protein